LAATAISWARFADVESAIVIISAEFGFELARQMLAHTK
jgi:hypothetical protein